VGQLALTNMTRPKIDPLTHDPLTLSFSDVHYVKDLHDLTG